MRRIAASVATATVIAFLLMVPAQTASACEEDSSWVTGCHVQNNGTQVDVGGTQNSNGSKGGPGSGVAPGSGSSEPDADSAPGRPAEPTTCELTGVCRENYTADPVLPDVTAADLASFVPAPPAFDAEPGGVGIVGMPTNFVASATSQTLAGTLFERPVNVRFVPAAYVFDHGDGSFARSTTGGAPWSSLGQAQFTATPTSHAYGERGVYEASVTVEYAAAVDFGTGWRPVNGIVSARAGGQSVEVFEARTALVDRTCLENPSGPGC